MMMLRCFAIFASLPLVVFGQFLYPCTGGGEASHFQNDIIWGFKKYFELEGILHDLKVRYNCRYEILTDYEGPYFLTFNIGKNHGELPSNDVRDHIAKALVEETKNAQSALKAVLAPMVDELMEKEEEREENERPKLVLNVGCFLAEDGKYYSDNLSAFCSFSVMPPPPNEF
ncbi:unnamed protein product [Cylicocyclus nassatus]|uniref:Uncharacterized protein n=1 Tax=Cylicocyclus nassatus TaxID=53992 RepID=A0AA36DQG0_CYLNA|nr:unnamed protein product [Cylicocyclus nassatus]